MKNNKNLINRDYAENDPNSMRSQLRRTGQIRTARELLDGRSLPSARQNPCLPNPACLRVDCCSSSV